MSDISRRSVVLSAAAAAAAFGLDRPLEVFRSAHAQEATSPKGFHTFKVGDLEVTTLSDGMWEKPHEASFIKNASVDETKAALRAAGLGDGAVPIPFTVTLVKAGGRTIMFDAGTGAQLAPTAGRLHASMTAAGIDPASIATIIVTHYHPDHIFGLMAKDTNAPVFPNAEIVLPAAEQRWWTDEGVFTKLPEARHGLAKRIQATLGQWKNVRLVEGDVEVAPGIRSVPTHGHTAGHTSYLLASGGKQLMVLGDISNIPALFVRNPGWHVMFDGDPQAAEAVRRKTYDRAIADGIVVSGYHFGMPGAGTIAKDGTGYAFLPVA